MKVASVMKSVGSVLMTIVLLISAMHLGELHPIVFDVNAQGTTYYVSTQGDDINGDGTTSNPWQTIQKAADTMIAGDTCIISAGTYYETISPANSGDASNPITFKAAAGEEVLISGADLITGSWTQHSGDIYKTTVTMTLDDGNQVFVDGEPMMEARWPNSSLTTDVFFSPTLAIADSGTTKTSIYDAAMQDIDWTGGQMWTTPRNGHGWGSWTSPILSYSNKTITINDNSLWSPQCDMKAGNEYYLYGKLEALDIDREWFYDSTNNLLYLYQPGGGDPSTSEVSVKKRIDAVDLSGKSYINIENIDVLASTITMDENTENCTIDSMTAKYISHYSKAEEKYGSQVNTTGIIVNGDGNEIKNSEISHSSGNGIVLIGSNHRVVNNYIHDVDYKGLYCSAVTISNGVDCMVSHNTLTKAGRSIIYSSKLNNCKIQYNDVSDPGLLVDDLGAIYLTWTDGGNTEVKYNVVYNTNGHEGIYLDNGSSNFLVHHNVQIGNHMRLNLPQEYSQIYNNSLSATIKGYYTTKHPNDGFGSRVVNNIASQVVQGCSEFVYADNLVSSSPGFVSSSDYHLQSTSPAIDNAAIIDGITDGYVGNAPDQGAYEYSGTDWTAGHDFANPPNPVFTEVDTLYMNRVKNAGFELGSFTDWTTSGSDTTITLGNGTEWEGTTGWIRTGKCATKMGTGANSIEQVITGLSPNTTYRVSAWMKVDSGETAEFKISGHGNDDVSVTQTYTNNWIRKIMTFDTGASSTSATMTLSKTSTTSGNVYWDDVGLQYVSAVVPSGNVAWYEFEDNADDSSDYGYDGTNNGATYVTGHIGTKALDFDGTDDYVSVPHNDNLTFGETTNTFTLTAWINTTAASGPIITKGRPNSLTNIDYNFGLSNGKLQLTRWHQNPDSSESVTDSDGISINDGSWHHVAFVNEGASSHKLYVDGELVETSTTAWVYDDSNSEPVYVGKYQNYTYGSTYFDGSIDNVKIFNYGLTESELLVEAGSFAPVAWYEFDDNVNDSSDNTLNGTNNGGVFVSGINGTKAVDFDGVDDYVSVGHNIALSFGAPSSTFSIAAWVKTTDSSGPIVTKGRPNSLTNIDYDFGVLNGKLKLSRWHQSPESSESIVDTDGTSINDGEWHHVVFVNASATDHKLYVDGSLVESSSDTWTYDDSNTEPLYVGKYQNYTYSTNHLDGSVDDVRIFDEAISAEYISDLADDTTPVTSPVETAWYEFEDDTTDSTTNSYDGTNYGASFVTGTVGLKALDFDGGDDYVSVAHNSDLTFGSASNEFTIAGWIKTTATDGPIVTKGRPTSQTHIDYNLRITGGKLGLTRWHQNPDAADSITDTDGTSINDGTWHHVAFVNEGSSSHKLYVDGVLVETSTTTWSNDDSNTQPVFIGKYQNYTYGTSYFDGSIDDVRIYNEALTDTEISNLAN